MSGEEQQMAPPLFKPRKQRANVRKTRATTPDEDSVNVQDNNEEVQGEVQRNKLEEIRLLHKVRKRTGGTNAELLAQGEKNTPDDLPVEEPEPEDAEQSELLGTFSKAETMKSSDEDPNMNRFIEMELAKRLGRQQDPASRPQEDAETKRRRLEAELYQVPEELQTSLGGGEVVIPGMNMVITEVPTSTEVRLGNIEATEAMKRRLLGGPSEEDAGGPDKATVRRGLFASSFGKAGRAKDRSFDSDQAEAEARRMRFVSERHAAVSNQKLRKMQKMNKK